MGVEKEWELLGEEKRENSYNVSMEIYNLHKVRCEETERRCEERFCLEGKCSELPVGSEAVSACRWYSGVWWEIHW